MLSGCWWHGVYMNRCHLQISEHVFYPLRWSLIRNVAKWDTIAQELLTCWCGNQIVVISVQCIFWHLTHWGRDTTCTWDLRVGIAYRVLNICHSQELLMICDCDDVNLPLTKELVGFRLSASIDFWKCNASIHIEQYYSWSTVHCCSQVKLISADGPSLSCYPDNCKYHTDLLW